mmetsp:Transcript_93759/g.183831  ORF Transcript_93759/g.183831 Transcript_93759/m.183831 type:complete len:584 (-) Transcript_93759:105-1856(-)
MLNIFKRAREEELVVLVLDSQFNEEFDMPESVVLAVPSGLMVDHLKRRIQGVTNVPTERILLLFCGEILFGVKTQIPVEAYEPTEIVDEDSGTFRPRLWMQVVADPVVHIKDEEPDADRRRNQEVEAGPEHIKAKHKKTHKTKDPFDLRTELEKIQCSGFFDVLTKQEYDNEGAFANLTSAILRGPGLWIPVSATRKILTISAQIKKRIADKDKDVNRNHYRNINLSAVSSPRDGDGNALPHHSEHHGQNELLDHAPSEASASNAIQGKNKADMRREWEAEVIRKKKAAKEEAAMLKAGLIRPKSDSLKEHTKELTAKIAEIRQRCSREADEGPGDFDEITGILYASYQRLRSVNRQEQQRTLSSTPTDLPPRASSAHALVSSPRLAGGDLGDRNATGSPSRVLRALRSSASSASFSVAPAEEVAGTGCGTVSKDAPPDYLRKTGFCCSKHAQAVLNNREAYYARRKVQHSLELQVMLERIPSASSGYVTSHSLSAIAQLFLSEYGGMPARSSDPSLVQESVERCRLDLFEQRSKVRCVQPRELSFEHLVSVLPVKWYCPIRFTEGFVELLEKLDRERLEEVT